MENEETIITMVQRSNGNWYNEDDNFYEDDLQAGHRLYLRNFYMKSFSYYDYAFSTKDGY